MCTNTRTCCQMSRTGSQQTLRLPFHSPSLIATGMNHHTISTTLVVGGDPGSRQRIVGLEDVHCTRHCRNDAVSFVEGHGLEGAR